MPVIRKRASFPGAENILELVVTVAQLCEYTKKFNCML